MIRVIILCCVILFACVGASAAQKKDAGSRFFLLPDGSYYEIPARLAKLDSNIIYCIAYSDVPERFSNRPPDFCRDFIAVSAMYLLVVDRTKTPVKSLVLPDGTEYKNRKGLTGRDLYCELKQSYPSTVATFDKEVKSIDKNFDRTPCTSLNVNIAAAFADATETIFARIAGAVALFFVLTLGILGKSRNTTLKQGRLFAAIGGSLAVAVVSVGSRDVMNYLYVLSINIVVYAIVGFLIGIVWHNIFGKPKHEESHAEAQVTGEPPSDNTQNDKGTQDIDNNDHWSYVLTELDAGNRDELLWARCVVAAEGDLIKAKADYLAQRVSQLKDATSD